MDLVIDNLFYLSVAFIVVIGFFSWFGKSDRKKRNDRRRERQNSITKPLADISENTEPEPILDHKFVEWVADRDKPVFRLIFKAHPTIKSTFTYYNKRVEFVHMDTLIGCIQTPTSSIDIKVPLKGILRFGFGSSERSFNFSYDTEILILEHGSEHIKQYFDEIQAIKDKKLRRKKAIELLVKLRELARRGVGGEKANAERMFHELLKKYNLKEYDIN